MKVSWCFSLQSLCTVAMAPSLQQEGLAVASIARDVGSSSTNRSSDIMHFLSRLLKTRGSAMVDGPHDALVSRNSATTKHPI